MSLSGKNILITGAARRVGKVMAIAVAQAGGNVIIHHGHSDKDAQNTKEQIESFGVNAWIVKSDLEDHQQIKNLIPKVIEYGPLFGLVNNASIFDSLTLENTNLDDWERHLRINLTAPFILSKSFAEHFASEAQGRIINILDWRALRPGADHFPYTISKSGLVALTRSLAIALAPKIAVNGLAFGAILPPSDGGIDEEIINKVPIKRWAHLDEVGEALIFLLSGPAYITGEIIHLDGGRHLV